MSHDEICENFEVFLEILTAKLAEVPLPGHMAQFEMLPDQWKTKKFKATLTAMSNIANSQNESAETITSEGEQNSKSGKLDKMRTFMKNMSTSSRQLFFPRATAVGEETRKNTMKTLKKTAVIVLFYPDEKGRTEFCLTRRAHYDGDFSGDVCLPGGKEEEEDDDMAATAVRETFEEIGVPVDNIEILGALSVMYAPNIHALIYPFVGFCKERPDFKRDEREVQEIIHVQLSELMADGNIQKKKQKVRDKVYDFPTYVLNNNDVFGITAVPLRELKDILSS